MQSAEPSPVYSGIAVDLSGSQHGQQAATEHFDRYFQHRVRHAVPHNFARHFEQLQTSLTIVQTVQTRKQDLLHEIAIRVACNVLYDHIMFSEINGIDVMFTMSHEYFKIRTRQIGEAIHRELDAYRAHIDWVIFTNDNEACEPLLRHLKGPGFLAMKSAYNLRKQAGGC